MPKKTQPYRSWQIEKLKDPAIASDYLNEALSDSPKMFLKALGLVAQSRQNFRQVARDAGISREALYRSLSEEGNPTFDTLHSVLDVLDLKIEFHPKT